MTDITDQELRDAIEWGRRNEYSDDPAEANAAIVILATVEAPAPTLAEELRGQAEWARRIGAPCNAEKIDSLAARAEQMEQERDEASAEVKRLTSERTSKESLRVDQPDPADVRPGEPWLIRVRGRDAVAIRDGHEEWPWSVAFIHGESDEAKDDVVTLVSRLVPAPRVITNHEELRALPTGAAIDHDGTAWLRRHIDSHLDFETTNRYGKAVDLVPATVLWEPEA